MMLNRFPDKAGSYFIGGPAGKLEIAFHFPLNWQQIPLIGLVCHPHPLYEGTMNNKVVTTTVRAFNQMNIAALRFNFRGVGQSQGSYGNTIGETEDLQAILAWLKQQKPNFNFWLAGFSFGSFIAAKVAWNSEIKQLVTIAPPVNHFDFNRIQKPECPWLVIQGSQDEVVSATEVFQWLMHYPKNIKTRVIEGASHFFHGRLNDLKDVLIQELSPFLLDI